MKRPLFVRLLLTVTTIAVALELRAGDDDEAFPFEGLVQLVPGGSIAAFHAQYGTSTIEAYPSQNIYRVALPPAIPEDTFEALVANDPQVLYADRMFPALDTNPTGSSQSFFFSEIEIRFSDQPVWEQIDLPSVAPHASAMGSGVVVAVVDTGIASHPFLTGSAAPGGYNFVNRNANTNDAFDSQDNNQNGVADEYAGHGTAIAGLIRRVAPQASLLPVRIMDDEGRCDTFKLVAGIHHAIDNGADIVNLSLGTIDASDILSAAIDRAVSANILVVTAAGNDDRPDPRRYPAGFDAPGLIAVATCDPFDIRAPFSNWGPHVDLTAPGVDLTSVFINLGFATGSGTSLSAPLVAGTLARMRSARPTAPAHELGSLLQMAADPIDVKNPSYSGELGSGRLNVARAVASVLQLGDLNCDSSTTVADIAGFVLALTNPTSYAATYPDCDINNADISGDGAVTVADIGPFVLLLTGG